MILQKDGKATPSVAKSLIERLPDESDLQWSSEERVAKNVLYIAYAGTWCNYPILEVQLTSLSFPRGPSQVVLIL
jgi:hypothetical protein